MRCRTVQRRLEAYLGGELTGKELARMERHLASCAECARAVERARRLRIALGQKATPPVPEGFHARLMARARQRAEQRSWRERILRPFGWQPAVPAGLRVAAAAAVILALGIGALIGRDMWRGPKASEAQPGQVAEAELVRTYRIDYLAEAPEGSLAGAYVSLVSAGGE